MIRARRWCTSHIRTRLSMFGPRRLCDDSAMNPTLQTVAEQSNFRLTGRLDEVEALSAALAAKWPDAVHSFVYGRSAEGRIMRALLVTRTGARTPQALQKNGIPLLMLQGGIHPGESDGKDAGFIALRELLEQPAPHLLEKIALLFVPAFNAD